MANAVACARAPPDPRTSTSAFAGKPLGDRRTQTTTGSGHKRDLSLQPHHCPLKIRPHLATSNPAHGDQLVPTRSQRGECNGARPCGSARPARTRAAPQANSSAWLGDGPDRTALKALHSLESGRDPATTHSPPGLRPGMGPIPIELPPLASWALAQFAASILLIATTLELFPVENISSASMKSATFSVVSWTIRCPAQQLDRAAARDAGQKRTIQSRGLDHAVLAINKLEVPASATLPSMSSTSALSKPRDFASITQRALLG